MTDPKPEAVTPVAGRHDIDSLLRELTTDEKARMLAGVDMWHFPGVERLGLPSIRVSDCGHGVTLGDDKVSPATCLPTGIAMASTWNPDLLERAGGVLGREARALGCSVLLGPKINLHRLPINGRSFETFSEDPWLAGLLGAAVIRGVQQTGVAACVKAMAANNQQYRQDFISAEVSEQALRELYLRNFQLAVEFGEPAMIMTAYNMINGSYPSEDPWLLRGVIKGEWRFGGVIVSDWRAVHSRRAIEAGLDIEMPGPGRHLNADGVRTALALREVSAERVDDAVRRILTLVSRYGQPDNDEPGSGLDTPENRAVARALADEAFVLLKNDGVLPLDETKLRRILVVGPNAAHARLGGGGSASVTPFYAVTPLAGIQARVGDTIQVDYLEGCSLVGSMAPIRGALHHHDDTGALRPGIRVDYSNDGSGEVAHSEVVDEVDFSWGWASPGPRVQRSNYTATCTGLLVPARSGPHRIGVFAQEGVVAVSIQGRPVLGTAAAGEGMRPENFETDFSSTYHVEQVELQAGVPVAVEVRYTKRVTRAALRLEWEQPGDAPGGAAASAAAADAVVVCVGLSNLFEGGARDRETLDLPDAQVALIEEVAAANPRTIVVMFNGGPLAMPWEPDVPAILEGWYTGQESGNALAGILFGDTNPSGRLPDSVTRRLDEHAAMASYPGADVVRYDEELKVGYRHLDAAGIEPHYPFGFGLSYTKFEISAPAVTMLHAETTDPLVEVAVTAANTGDRTGAAVVQLYLRTPGAGLLGISKELRGFQKVSLLPREERTLTFRLGTRELERWDADEGWRVEPGTYRVLVGEHSRDLAGVDFALV